MGDRVVPSTAFGLPLDDMNPDIKKRLHCRMGCRLAVAQVIPDNDFPLAKVNDPPALKELSRSVTFHLTEK